MDNLELIKKFHKIGMTNYWISRAVDPPFTLKSFYVCKDIDDFVEKIAFGNWVVGQAFVLDDMCFIEQVDGGNEYLVIKGDRKVDSASLYLMYKNGTLLNYIQELKNGLYD